LLKKKGGKRSDQLTNQQRGENMNSLIRKLMLEGYRAGKRINEIDISNPLAQDTASFVIDILKIVGEVIKP
jgi:hypothetical protein